ncbi:MAG: hypothetical protein ACO1OB_00605 [Archangium sp.]
MFRVFIAVCSVCAMTVFAAPKKGSTKTRPVKAPVEQPVDVAKQDMLKAVLSGIQKEVANCVVGNEADRPGEWKQTVAVKVTLDAHGSVMENKISLDPETADAKDTRSCVEEIVKGLKWPAPHAPLTIVEREWTFAFK